MRSTQGCARRTGTVAALVAGLLLGACQPRDPDVHTEQLAALGTLVTVHVYATPAEQARQAVARLERHLRERGRDWYPWADGELARINTALAEGRSAPVSAALQELLERATQIEELSGGRFNAALGRLSELWGFDDPVQNNWKPPTTDRVAALAGPHLGLRALRWDGSRVSSVDTRVMIDPGGIAKGALLAESVALLQEAGIDNAIVDIGGDLVVLGTAGPRRARIGIREPGTDSAIGWVEAQGGETVVTSGNYERYFEHDGRRYAHVLDPATGYPADGTASVTVIHTDPLLADAAATALLVGGADEFDQLCAVLGVQEALLVAPGGDLRLTAAMRSRVHWLARD